MADQYDISLEKGIRGALPRKHKKTRASGSVWFYLGMVGQIGYTIAIPLAGGAIIGSLFDRSFGTGPTGVLTGIGIGFIISLFGFIRIIKDAVGK